MGWDPAQKGDYDRYLKTIALPQAREIIDRYNPAILWWDTPQQMTPERVAPFAALVAERTPDGVIIQLPGSATDLDVSVARLEFPGTLTQQPFNTPDAEGTLTLPALDADPHGAVGGNIRVEGTGDTAYLTDWKQSDYRVEYCVKTDNAANWTIQAEIASTEATRLTVSVGNSSHTIDVPATGSGLTWTTIPLGSIALPAEETVIQLKPAAESWKPIHLRKLTLQPLARSKE
jgi:hypothetical protein